MPTDVFQALQAFLRHLSAKRLLDLQNRVNVIKNQS